MTINNPLDFFTNIRNELNHPDTKIREQNKEYYKKAGKDLPEDCRDIAKAIYKGEAVDDNDAKKTAAFLQKFKDKYDAATPEERKSGISVRDTARENSWGKSIARAFSNLFGRLGSAPLVDFIQTSKKPLALLNDPEVLDAEAALYDPHAAALSTINKFTSDQLLTFKTVLSDPNLPQLDPRDPNRGIRAVVEGSDPPVKVIMWYRPHFNAINIQLEHDYVNQSPDNKMGVIISDKGKITSLFINGKTQVNEDGTPNLKVPDNFLPLITTCYKESLKRSSKYEISGMYGFEFINITTVGHGLNEVPEFHLAQLSKCIVEGTKKNESPDINVIFLGAELENQQGIDAGGPGRDYVDTLSQALMKSNQLNLNQVGNSSLVFPGTKGDSLTDAEKAIYTQIGHLAMYCYHSDKNYSMSQCFDEAVFAAALSLTADEINQPLTHLSEQKILQKIVDQKVKDHPTRGDLKTLQQVISLYTWDKDSPRPADDLLTEAHNLLGFVNMNDELAEFEDDFAALDMEKIKSPDDLAKFMGYVQKAILTAEFETPPLGGSLEPIHQMAVGMKSVCDPGNSFLVNPDNTWDTKFNRINPLEFSEKVQGSMDRKAIIAAIEIDPTRTVSSKQTKELEKKEKWLKNWIENEATNEELQNLLKFWSGSSSLTADSKLHIWPPVYTEFSCFPESHACFNRLNIAHEPRGATDGFNDKSEKAFIQVIKTVIDPRGAKFTAA